jgi:hypothetical protein
MQCCGSSGGLVGWAGHCPLLLRFLRAVLKTVVTGATSNTLAQALAAFATLALFGAALWQVEVIAPGLALLVTSPVTHRVARDTFDGASTFALTLALVRPGDSRRGLAGSRPRDRSQGSSEDGMDPRRGQGLL